jgi:hypothetical protein
MATITFRADSAIEAALAELMADGHDRSQAIRDAILTAQKLHQARRLRQEAESLAADPDDVAEARQVLAELENLRAW